MRKKRVVKGWAVIKSNGSLRQYERAVVFPQKDYAHWANVYDEKVIPCTITYEITRKKP